MKDDNDNPSIGLLVCKSKNETVVKWAFEGIDRPLGIATYELDEVLKKTLAEKLPSIEHRKCNRRVNCAETLHGYIRALQS